MKEFAEKMIERLEELKNEVMVLSDIVWNNAVNICIKEVNQLAEEYNQDSTKNNQGWILCSDRLPEDCDNRFYMCTVENHEEDSPMFYQYEEGYGFGFWQDFYDEHTLGFVDSEFKTNEELGCENVIAWQPLPEPYNPLKPNSLDKVSQEPKTRIDHIRSMSVEEMADAIIERDEINIAIGYCHNFEECWEGVTEDECKKCLIEYLNSPVEQRKAIPTQHFEDRFNTVK